MTLDIVVMNDGDFLAYLHGPVALLFLLALAVGGYALGRWSRR